MKTLLATLILITSVVSPVFGEEEDIYYCIVKNFVEAREEKVKNYRAEKFTMKVVRKTKSSKEGRLEFSNSHPLGVSINVNGINSGWITDSVPSGGFSVSFYPEDGAFYQSWSTGFGAVALAAKCDNF